MSSIPVEPADDRKPAKHRSLLSRWRNRLRGKDVRTVAGACLVLGCWLLSLPILATVGSAMWASRTADIEQQQSSRLPATAQLLQDAPDFTFSNLDPPGAERISTPAQWVVDGMEHTGNVTSAVGARLGDRVQVWVDRAGNIGDPPDSAEEVATLIILGTAAAWLSLGGLLGVMWQAARWQANRRRLANVDREWEQFEPVWSSRPERDSTP